jgi:hypothetical protein
LMAGKTFSIRNLRIVSLVTDVMAFSSKVPILNHVTKISRVTKISTATKISIEN